MFSICNESHSIDKINKQCIMNIDIILLNGTTILSWHVIMSCHRIAIKINWIDRVHLANYCSYQKSRRKIIMGGRNSRRPAAAPARALHGARPYARTTGALRPRTHPAHPLRHTPGAQRPRHTAGDQRPCARGVRPVCHTAGTSALLPSWSTVSRHWLVLLPPLTGTVAAVHGGQKKKYFFFCFADYINLQNTIIKKIYKIPNP